MPSVNVVGTLLDPLGIYAKAIELRFIAISTQGQTVESSSASYFTDNQGQYNFSLEYGRYTIEVNLDIEYFLTGEVIVDAATPNPLSLTQLIDYLPAVVPPVIVPELPDWEILHRALRTATDTVIKDKIDPLASEGTYTQEIKQLFLNERLGADMAEENVLTEVGTAKVEAQTNVYADALNHQSIQNTSTSVTNHGSMVNAEAIYDASNGKVVVESSKELSTSQSAYKKNVELTDTSFSDTEETTLGTSGFTRTQVANSNAVEGITEVNLNVPKGYVKGTRTDSLKKSYVPLAGNPVNKPKIELGTSTELVTDTHSAKAYETQTLLLDANDELQTTQERGIVAYLKKAYQRIVNNGFLSQMFTRVDRYIVESSTGIAVLTVDTINKVLRIDGRLEITNPEDFKGEPGDTIFEVFKYSQTAEGSPNGAGWHAEFVIGDNWRIFNTSVNGYVDPTKWSIPVQLNGKDGAPGDTLYFQYQYSADKANWHTIMEDLDIWRRERVIENGAPTTAWSEGVRIRGFDGADADLTQYEYSYATSGLAAPAEWHFNFSTGDHFRRERIIYFRTLEDRDAYVPGANNTFYQATPWNNIMQIVPIDGVDYGAKQATIYLYRRSNTFPPAPTGDLTWNFNDLTILPIGNLNGWSLQVPTGNENVYVALAVATSLGSEDVIGANEWNIEQWGSEGADGSDGIDGIDGKTPAVANLFCISVTQPAVNFTSVTQTLATNAMVVNGSNTQGWQGTVPANTTPGGRVWYMTNAQLVLTTATTATHLAADFSVPTVFSQNGLNGAAGLNNATVMVYQRATTTPTKPSVSTTYTFATKVLAGLNNGWTQTIPTGTNPLYVTAATASANMDTDTIAATEWADPTILTQNGLNSASVFLYQRKATLPTVPSGTCTYTFATGVLTGQEALWTQSVPSGTDLLYVTTATATSIASTDTIASTEWAIPIILAKNGTDGTNGIGVTGVINYYQKSSSSTVPPTSWVTTVPTLDTTNKYLWNYEKVNYSSGNPTITEPALIGTLSVDGTDGKGIVSITEWYLASASASGVTTATAGWTTSPQLTDTTKRYLWNYEVVKYTIGADTITAPVVIGTHGEIGASGLNNATVYLYQRAASTPSNPSANVTYTFATKAISGQNNGWLVAVPAGTNPLYVTVASASSASASDVIAPAEWTPPTVLAQNGANGVPGTKGADGVTTYTWIRYADSVTGSGISNSPTGKAYIGFAYNKISSVESNVASDYAWLLIKGDTGIGITSVVNKYGLSASAGTEPSTWTATVPTATQGLPYLWNKEIVTYTNGDTVTTPAAIIGMFTKDGKGIASVTEYYLASSLSIGVTTATAGWTTAIQHTTVANRFLWNYEVTTYTDGSTNTTAPVVIGTQGINGVGVSSIVNYYLISAAGSGVTTGTAGWTQAVQIPTKASRYLWNYEKVTYTNGTVENTQPAIIGTYSENGVSITGVTEYYQVGTSGSVAPAAPASWPTLAPLTSTANKYLWNYEKISYSDGTTTSTAPVVIGVHGEQGNQGVPGVKGADGVTTYTWVKYSDNPDGTGLYDLPTNNTKYIGIAVNKTIQSESNLKTDYVWSQFKGDAGPQGVPGAAGAAGVTTYTWIKYADSATGTGLSNDPTGKAYIGFAYNKTTATESNTAGDYTWSLVKGAQGNQGVPGAKGADGTTPYTWIKYSDNADGTGLYDTPTVNTKYIGIAVNKTVQAESSVKTDYVWSQFKGDQGPQGVPGAKGTDGVTTYTWIKYADSSAGAGLSNAPTGKAYIGFAYNKTTATESDTASDYTWSLIQGPQGNTGVPGVKGADGVTTYTWVKYSDVADGTGLYDTPTANTLYIGIATNKTVAAESAVKTDYIWSKFRGDNGLNSATVFLYQRATSAPAKPSTTCTYTFATGVLTGQGAAWTQTVPNGTAPLYLTTATAASVTTTDVIASGEWAVPTILSRDGDGVATITNYYAKGTSSTVAPTGWSTAIPTLDATNKYMWNYEKVVYTSGKEALTLPALIGTLSADGKGIVSITEYYLLTSTTTSPSLADVGWTTTPLITTGVNKYLWNKEVVKYTSGADTISGPALIGTHGLAGEAGFNTATIHIYIRSAATLTGANLPTSAINYTFATGAVSGLNNGWTTAIPSGTDPLWISTCTALSQTATDTIAPAEWSAPTKFAENGLNTASVFLYIRAASVPSVPSTASTYTFATGILTGHNNGWSRTVPAGANTLYITTATAISTAATDVIAPSEWATPNILAQNGTNGANGANGTNGTNGKHGQGSFRKYATAIPSNAQKDIDVAAIAARAAQDGDLINYYKDDGVASSKFSRYFFRQSGGWVESAYVVNGNSVIDGTLAAIKLQAKSITGDQISSATTLLAGVGATQAGMNGLDSGIYNNWRFWSGNASPALAPFRVNGQGAVFASNITISGGSLNIGNLFNVTSAGVVTIQSAPSATESRLVLVGDRLEVYEGTQLRVRIGRL